MPPVHAAGIDIGVCWGTAINAPLPDLIAAAAAAGFNALTVSNALVESAHESGLSDGDIRALLDAAGMKVAYIDPLLAGLPGACPIEKVPAALQRFFRFGEEQVLAAATALGTTAINIAHFLGDASTPTAALTEAVASLARRAARGGLTVLVEFLPGTGIPDLNAAAAIVAGCGEKNVQITLDTWHFARSNSTIGQIEALPGGMIAGMQISDWAPPQEGAPFVMMTGRRMPGRGVLPLPEIIAAARRNNPALYALVEVLDADRARLPAAEIMRETAREMTLFDAAIRRAAIRRAAIRRRPL
jgi:sugar phosphate isomerase/epimerase